MHQVVSVWHFYLILYLNVKSVIKISLKLCSLNCSFQHFTRHQQLAVGCQFISNNLGLSLGHSRIPLRSVHTCPSCEHRFAFSCYSHLPQYRERSDSDNSLRWSHQCVQMQLHQRVRTFQASEHETVHMAT